MADTKTVAVLGGGSFGTAIANMVAQNGHQSCIWMRNDDRVKEITETHENSRYMPGYMLEPSLKATTDMVEAVSNADIIFVSIPSKSFRTVLEQLAKLTNDSQIIVSTTKGIENDTFKLMSQVLQEVMPNNPIGVISGPNLAKEIAKEFHTGTVIASDSESVRNTIQSTLHSRYFRVYANSDMYGVELGGALKNIYAIATGMATALGMGENTKSLIMTRSLTEMSRFAVTMGADPLTFLGLAGVGDLIVTCSSSLSRNFRVGYAIGEGRSLDEAIESLGEVAEGVNTLKLVKEKAEEKGVYMPLAIGLYDIVFNQRPVADVVNKMMASEQGSDVEFVLPAD